MSIRHSGAVLIVAAILAVLSGVATLRLTFDPDILNLVPQHNKEVNDFRRIVTELGTIDQHVVVFQLPPARGIDDYSALIDEIGTEYERLPGVESVEWLLPDPMQMMGELLPKAMLLLTPEEIEKVRAKLTDEAIGQAVERNRALLQTPQASAVTPLIEMDPFNLLPIFMEKMQGAGRGFNIDVTSGYYLSGDGTAVLMLVRPERPAQDMPFSRSLIERGRELEERSLARFRESSPDVPAPEIGHTGGYAIAVSDAGLIGKDVIVNVLTSFVGVLLLFFYAFRRWTSVLYAAVPMGLAIIITFGLASLVLGELSSSSALFAALVAGLGIDFITVLYERFAHERNRGLKVAEALHITMDSTLPGVLLAAITTSAVFYAYLATDFRGMSQLGFLTATGVLVFFLCVLFVLPALLVRTQKDPGDGKPLHVHTFGADRLIDVSLARPRFVVIAWIIFAVACLILMPRLRFNDSVANFRASSNAATKLQSTVTEKFGQSLNSMMVVAEGPDIETALARTQEARATLTDIVARGELSSYQSIATIVPPIDQQQAVIKTLEDGRSDDFSMERIESTFRTALRDEGFREDAWDGYLLLFGQSITPERPLRLEDFESETLEPLVRRFIRTTSSGVMSVTHVYPVGPNWRAGVPPALMELGERPGITVTGINLVTTTLRRIIKDDAIRSTIWGVIGVFILFGVVFRSLKKSLIVFIPLTAGAIGMLGLMALFDLEFNLVNVFVGLMLVGVATDYAVYMMQRFVEEPSTFHIHAHETCKAVVMAALTSMVGFGSFITSSFPGLRSIGYASLFGIGISCLATITILPVVLLWRHGRGERAKVESVTNLSS